MNDFLPLLPFIYTFAALLAASLGSFANVVIYRLPHKVSLISPPSTCPNCQKRIKPWDNIPILSWIILLGKCRNCKSKISIQYPIIELVSALLGLALVYQIFQPRLSLIHQYTDLALLFLAFFFLLLFSIACLTLTVIDLKYTELPPEICYSFTILGLAFAYFLPERFPFNNIIGNLSFFDAALGSLIGASIVFIIIAGYYIFTKRIGMGGGDIGMMAMVGAFLGWQSLVFIFLAASLQGICIAIIGILLGKKQQSDNDFALFRNDILEDSPTPEEREIAPRKLAIPFGPFIAIAAIEYLFFGEFFLKIMTASALSPWGFNVF